MYCSRLDHNVRLNPNGTVSLCGHMIAPPQFRTYDEMISSSWLTTIKETMSQGHWPTECNRCQQTESISNSSIRMNMLEFTAQQKNKNYLVVGGVIDNVCNSACQTCNENLSTKIGSLKYKSYPIIDNSKNFYALPQERITHLDITGGEPSASKNYKKLLENLPPNVESIRLNTNCSTVLDELVHVIDKGVKVTVTISLDGIGDVHNYVRWPIQWEKFVKNLLEYKKLGIHSLNTWTTVSALNINDFENILNFVKQHNLDHSWALLASPKELSVLHKNNFTLDAKEKLLSSTNPVCLQLADRVASKEYNQEEIDRYIKNQDSMRNILISNYIK